MALLNYTTEVPVDKSLAEISRILARGKAAAIMSEFDGFGNVAAISFRAKTEFGVMAFRLPIDVKATEALLRKHVNDGGRKRWANNQWEEQARRVGWRVIKDWIEAQMALIETGMVKLEQVMLPFAHTPTGETFYERLRKETPGFRGSMLQLEN